MPIYKFYIPLKVEIRDHAIDGQIFLKAKYA